MKYLDQVRFAWYHHVLFWAAYVLFWSVRDLVHHDIYLDNIQLNLISTSIYGLMAYANVYLLVPHLLLKRKYLNYLIILLGCFFVTAAIASQAIRLFLNHVGHLEAAALFSSTRGLVILTFEAVFVTLVTLAIVLVKIYMIKDTATQELIKKNLETELNFLKNQINPHFLFNSLNSIYFLIPKNQKKAAEMVLKFSDMLSHQLYQGNKQFIPMENEIKYLENYIELEKIRQGERVNVDWQVDGDTKNTQIAPMIFLTFLENAFKHGQLVQDDHYQVEGRLSVDHDQIKFQLVNQMPEESAMTNGSNGVGLENTKRRLELLYPDHHDLIINKSQNNFSVELTIHQNAN